VAELRRLTRADLAAFARRVLAPGPGRRKLAVLVRGGAERRQGQQPEEGDAAAAPAETAAAGPELRKGSAGAAARAAAAAAALGEGERLAVVWDASAFKRGCELHAAARLAAAAARDADAAAPEGDAAPAADMAGEE
jgi:hypothetical protein